METINILLADNQTLTRQGIIAILTDFYGKSLNIKEINTKEELYTSLKKFDPNILIIDFELFDLSEISDLRDIKKTSPSMAILVVSDNKSPIEILKVVDSGITNYVLKSCESQELLDAFHAAMQSRKYFCNEIMDVILDHKTSPKNIVEHGNLTSSEVGIVRLITQGLTTKEIAEQKHLSFHTIITHRKNIFRKLGITNSSELLMYAMRNGIIDTTEYYI
jgi:DNA-binding NarL/FixJ family response regulator